MTKYCGRGKHEVPKSSFSKSKARADGLNSWCKPCMATYERERYQNGDKSRKQRNIASQLQRSQAYVWELFSSSKCVDCGNSDPRVLEFDHREPDTKFMDVAAMYRGYSLESIKAEIAKCDIRCANCHRIRTGVQFGHWRTEKGIGSSSLPT